MYESSGLHFFRTTTVLQSGLESRLVYFSHQRFTLSVQTKEVVPISWYTAKTTENHRDK